jgi:hypothetical protein
MTRMRRAGIRRRVMMAAMKAGCRDLRVVLTTAAERGIRGVGSIVRLEPLALRAQAARVAYATIATATIITVAGSVAVVAEDAAGVMAQIRRR